MPDAENLTSLNYIESFLAPVRDYLDFAREVKQEKELFLIVKSAVLKSKDANLIT